MDGFERELSEALVRRPAPPSLKHKVMERRRGARRRQPFPLFAWRGLAASFVSVLLCILAALAIYGGYEQQQAEQRRKGEEAKQQVFTALRIANHALEEMNAQLKQQDKNFR